MLRDVDIREISDGRFYTAGDMVRADTGDCRGCSHCCRQMVDTIFLDPWDLYQLQAAGWSFDALMAGGSGQSPRIELEVADGLILPHLKPAADGACPFLDAAERCSIHERRPGFCRLFPLGRYYEGDDFRYILQVKECIRENRTKVKVKKWLGIAQLGRYEQYIRQWHAFTGRLRHMADETQSLRRQLCMAVLEEFYTKAWDTSLDFYDQFEQRLRQAGARCGIGM